MAAEAVETVVTTTTLETEAVVQVVTEQANLLWELKLTQSR